jgi:hypothetical protein
LIAIAVMLYLASQGLNRSTDLMKNMLAVNIDTGGGWFIFLGLGLAAHLYIWWNWLRLSLHLEAIKPLALGKVYK